MIVTLLAQWEASALARFEFIAA